MVLPGGLETALSAWCVVVQLSEELAFGVSHRGSHRCQVQLQHLGILHIVAGWVIKDHNLLFSNFVA